MSFANLTEQVPLGPSLRLRANKVTGLAKGRLVDENANFLLYAEPGDRIIAPDERKFVDVSRVVSNTELELVEDTFTKIGSRYDLIRPARTLIRPGLGAESIISLVRVEASPAGGPYELYTVELVRTNGRRRTLIARSDSTGRLMNVAEIKLEDGKIHAVNAALLPRFFEWYEILNYRLASVDVVVEGMDKTFVSTLGG